MSIEEAQELFVRQVLQHCESLEHEFEVLTFFRELYVSFEESIEKWPDE